MKHPTSPKFENLTARNFGRLRVIHYCGRTRSKNSLWLCKCSCGAERIILSTRLKNGTTQSCGCLSRELAFGRFYKHGETNKTPEYRAWSNLRRRCNDPTHPKYGRYGLRGIKVCRRWDDYLCFLHDMGRKPQGKYSIDRCNNNGNYTPTNCRWATAEVQSRNTSKTVITLGVAKKIRALRLSGMTQAQIVAATGIARCHIGNVIYRRTKRDRKLVQLSRLNDGNMRREALT